MSRSFYLIGLLAALSMAACGDATNMDANRSPLELPRGIGKADSSFSCKGFCGKQAPGGCYCDEGCTKYGDCCPDKVAECDTPIPPPIVCGGIAGLPCPPNMKCKMDIISPDATGKCVPETYCDTKADCIGLVSNLKCPGDWVCEQNTCKFKCGPVPVGCTSNNDCAATDYCEFGDGMCLSPTLNILEGKCVTRPQLCPMYYSPVCGCDGKTYGNKCEAHAAGTSVAKPGKCQTQPKTCGPFPGGQCASGEVCNIKSCGLGATGKCTTKPTIQKCAAWMSLPVCGCDGKTYGNDCLRLMVGTPLKHVGKCKTTGKCTSNGDCNGNEYCEFGDGMCLSPTFTILEGKCLKRPQYCLAYYSPVCGCDGKTYGNECEAHAGGTSVAKKGKCNVVPPPPGPKCKGFCGQKSPFGCYCDAACVKHGDCCPDYYQECSSLPPNP